jgi:hypothetical protein
MEVVALRSLRRRETARLASGKHRSKPPDLHPSVFLQLFFISSIVIRVITRLAYVSKRVQPQFEGKASTSGSMNASVLALQPARRSR